MANLGGKIYPIYAGFISPRDLHRIAEAPSFDERTTNHELAASTLTVPMERWQRPLDGDRVRKISEYFNKSSDLMPNPVLLAESATHGQRLSVAPSKLQDQSTGPTFDVTLPSEPHNCLWILDGQHRIAGLNASNHADVKIPVVLLLNGDGPKVYDGSVLARIFAQVTTAAKGLEPLHNDWLQFAFRLGDYAQDQARQDAMRTVAILASKPRFQINGQIVINEFYNSVQFNDFHPFMAKFRPKAYNCIELKDIVLQDYFRANPTQPLSPEEVAAELALAYSELLRIVPRPDEMNAIVGTSGKSSGYVVMRDGFISGCLHRLVHNGSGTDWGKLLTTCGFNHANWDFSSWVKSLRTDDNVVSHRIARAIFSYIFELGHLPNSVPSLEAYFQGNGASVTIESSKPTPKGRRPRTGPYKQHPFAASIGLGMKVTDDTFLRVERKTPNIGKIEVMDLDTTVLTKREYPQLLRGGMQLVSGRYPNPLKLGLKLHLFGGTEADIKLTVTW
jgi:DGQHR domain-containing protein